MICVSCPHHPFLCSLSSNNSKAMAVFVSGYINDLSAVKDNITLRVRVLRSWTQEIYNKPHVKNLEMILMDENVSIIFLMIHFFVQIICYG